MSLALTKAGSLKPEVRLGLAVSEFEAVLSPVQKSAFRVERIRIGATPPSAQDVLQLTTQIDKNAAASRCYGPRFNTVLHAIQKFATIGDILIGGSQNVIACGVWTVVRLGILSLSSNVMVTERLSLMFMKAGQALPRHEKLSLLFPRSKDLQRQVCEYLIIVIKLCSLLVKASTQNTLQRLFKLSDLDLRDYQFDLDLWAGAIREEVQALVAEGVAPVTQYFGSLALRNDRLTEKQRILDACSTYDYEATWKQKRNAGIVESYKSDISYQNWSSSKRSAILIIKGKLGSGKSVLIANIIAELHTESLEDRLITFFFCRYDDRESLDARAVLGSFVKQLVQTLSDKDLEAITVRKQNFDINDLMDLIKKIMPQHKQIFFLLDGIGEMPTKEADKLLLSVKALQQDLRLHFCFSIRKHKAQMHLPHFQAVSIFEMSIQENDNPDMKKFVIEKLQSCLNEGLIHVCDPLLILEIHDALVAGAQGMFLWVALQIETLCKEHTDSDLRKVLKSLPTELAEIFTRILTSCKTSGSCQEKILQLTAGSSRPSSIEELQEALSVEPGQIKHDISHNIHDIQAALSCCGSLVVVDEESKAVSFTHQSVLQYLTASDSHPNVYHFTDFQLNKVMADIIITYLNYEEPDRQVAIAKNSISSLDPSNILRAGLAPSIARDLALKLLAQKKAGNLDVSKAILGFLSRADTRPSTRHFHGYAKRYLLHHVWTYLAEHDRRMITLLSRIIPSSLENISDKDQQTIQGFAASKNEHELFPVPFSWDSEEGLWCLLITKVTFQLETNVPMYTVLGSWDCDCKSVLEWLISMHRTEVIRSLLTQDPVGLGCKGQNYLIDGLILALLFCYYDIAELVLSEGDLMDWRPWHIKFGAKISMAGINSLHEVVPRTELLNSFHLFMPGREFPNSRSAYKMFVDPRPVPDYHSSWTQGITNIAPLATLAFQKCNSEGWLDLSDSKEWLQKHKAWRVIQCSSSDTDVIQELILQERYDTVLEILIKRRSMYGDANTINARNSKQETLLMHCIEAGQYKMVSALIQNGADTALKDRNGLSPMERAIYLGKVEVVRVLADSGAVCADDIRVAREIYVKTLAHSDNLLERRREIWELVSSNESRQVKVHWTNVKNGKGYRNTSNTLREFPLPTSSVGITQDKLVSGFLSQVDLED